MYVGFFDIEPEVAQKTIRSFEVRAGVAVPAGEYGLIEFYCPKPGCDCRQVTLMVVRSDLKNSLAVITHSFPGGDHGPSGDVTFLDPMSSATPLAEDLLDIVGSMLVGDTAFELQLQEHYAMVKRAVADPDHPCHVRLAELKNRPRPKKGSHLPPGSIGTEKSPVCVTVQDDEQLQKVANFAEELNVHYIARIDANSPVDLGDLQRVGQMATAAPPELSRHERRRWEKIHKRKK